MNPELKDSHQLRMQQAQLETEIYDLRAKYASHMMTLFDYTRQMEWKSNHLKSIRSLLHTIKFQIAYTLTEGY